MSNTTSFLNDLIETLKDGQEGFQSASENVKSPDLKTLFSEFAQQRAQFSGELRVLAQNHGETDPEDSSSVASAIHRGWINLKSALTSQDDHAILAECERGEDSSVAEYKKAIAAALPADVASVIQTQYIGIKAAHDQVKALRDAKA